MDFQKFPENVHFQNLWYSHVLCTPANVDRGMRRQYDIHRMSGSRFPVRMHALDSIEYILNRFGDFYFSAKMRIFGNP